MALSQYAQDKQIEISCTVWGSAEAFLDQYKHQYEIIFMDIRLPGMDGMRAARHLREMDHTVLLVFLTTLAQYAVEGYEVEAIDYIIKPITYASLRLKMPRLLRRCSVEEQEIIIQSSEQSIKLRPSELMYVEIFDHHMQFMTDSDIIKGYGTLKDVEKLLPEKGFFRLNNQTIVNLRFVKNVDKENVILDDREFPLSRRRRKGFLEALQSSGIRM